MTIEITIATGAKTAIRRKTFLSNHSQYGHSKACLSTPSTIQAALRAEWDLDLGENKSRYIKKAEGAKANLLHLTSCGKVFADFRLTLRFRGGGGR